MADDQDKTFFVRLMPRQRLLASGLALVVGGLFGSLIALQWIGYDIGILFGPCGFQQRYGLPCPTCGMTTAIIAFAKGRVIAAFIIQPAAGLLCLCGLIAGTVAFVGALTGSVPRFLLNNRHLTRPGYLLAGIGLLVLVVWLIRLLAIWARH